MFGKLMKYELKSLSKSLLPLYGAILAVALLNSILGSGGRISMNSLPQTVAISLYLGLCVSVGVATLLVVVQRFYKGLLGQEGYLMFTLPVPTWQLTCSKLLGATIMSFLSGAVGILSIFILACSGIRWDMFLRNLSILLANWTIDLSLLSLEMFLITVTYLVSSILQIYLAMAIGHLFNRHRVAMSFLWFVIISTILSFISGWCMDIIGALPSPSGWIFSALLLTPFSGMHGFLWGSIIASMILCGIFYLITNWILENRLNLE